MGIRITNMFADYGDAALNGNSTGGKAVFHLAEHALSNTLDKTIPYSHLLAATSCPDAIAPSLGQCINQRYNSNLGVSHTIDMVQGCAGGVSALILASQLAELNKSNVLVVTADAAQKATSPSSAVFEVFKNGVFACCVAYSEDDGRLLHHQSKQYKDLYNVVTIGLGHDADAIIAANISDMTTDPRRYLGLRLDNHLAIKLMKEAERFYLDFIEQTGHPDFLILHQVNEPIINHLEKVFAKYPIRFINKAKETGNCGCATTGILLDILKHEIKNKKVMICSFGTGGVITAGLWQF
ncbi:MAG TPA: 3-oxoacyl-[acyl-carrier-protein] synthase III C-terminal domain-containing protein [Chitinophagaceae bacterium]